MRLTRRVSVVVGSVVGGLTVVGAAWAAGGSPTEPGPSAALSGTSVSSSATSSSGSMETESAAPTVWSDSAAPTVWSEAAETTVPDVAEPTVWSESAETTVPDVAEPTVWSGAVETAVPEAAEPTTWSGPAETAAPDAVPADVEGSGAWIDVYEPVDLSGQLILHTTNGATVTPTDEGAVTATSEPQTITVPTAWTLLPVADRYQLATVALTDNRPTCLSVTGPGAVGLESCDAGRSTQLLRLDVSPTTSAGAPVEIRFDGGYLAVTDRGSLTAAAEPTGSFLLSAVATPQP